MALVRDFTNGIHQWVVGGRPALRTASFKSNIGHLECGAGAASLAKLFLVLSQSLIPPSLHLKVLLDLHLLFSALWHIATTRNPNPQIVAIVRSLHPRLNQHIDWEDVHVKVVTECEPLSGEMGSMPAGCVSWMTSKTLIPWDTGFEERTSHSSIGNLSLLCMKKLHCGG